jgi:protocatechuate 4,5-dioxygenase, beta chain
MAEIVGGFLMPHDPLITGGPEQADPGQMKNVLAAYGEIAERARALDATTAIIIGDDHYVMFGPHCLPQMLIGIGDLEGPIEPWLRIDRGPVENNVPLARHVMEKGFDEGFDWAVAKVLTLDHATMVPFHLVARPAKMKTIPVYLACGVEPVIRPRRAHQVGQLLRKAVESFPGDDRVVVFGTGGISHWVGEKEMGRVNEEFDRKVLGAVENGDVEALIALDDRTILEQGGNGALEIRNFICAMGAVAGLRGRFTGRVICYEPMPALITGLGFAELQAA